jgi:hypothetical protein
MSFEFKELRCECGCNVFTIRKTRDTVSVYKKKGTRDYFCVDCNEIMDRQEVKTRWEEVDWRIKKLISKRWDRMKARIERLSRNNKRQSEWIDRALEGKL